MAEAFLKAWKYYRLKVHTMIWPGFVHDELVT